MKFKVGDKVKYVGHVYTPRGIEGVVIYVTTRGDYPLDVDFTPWGDNLPCSEDELELVE